MLKIFSVQHFAVDREKNIIKRLSGNRIVKGCIGFEEKSQIYYTLVLDYKKLKNMLILMNYQKSNLHLYTGNNKKKIYQQFSWKQDNKENLANRCGPRNYKI